MALGEFPIVHHYAGGGVGGDIVVPPVHGGRFVDIGEEGFDSFLNGIGAAKGAHNSLLLPSAFADWIASGLLFCLVATEADKSQKAFEIRAFRQKKSTAILIRFVSKLRCFSGRGGQNRYF